MVSALDSGSNGPGSSPSRDTALCCALCSLCSPVFIHPGV